MAGLGRTFRQAVYEYFFRGGATPIGTTSYFISLHTGDPGVDGAGANEVSTTSTGYARQAINITGGWTAATAAEPSVITNAAIVAYSTATASWGTISFFGLWKASTGSTAANFVAGGAITTPQAVASGNTASFAIGALTMSINNT